MTETEKYLIPFLFEKNEGILDKKYGFIGAYTDDINKPYLYNHLFLVYESNALQVGRVYKIAEKSGYLHSMYHYKINDKYYSVIAFTRPNLKKEFERIMNAERLTDLPFEHRQTIQNFNSFDILSDEFQMLFNPNTINLRVPIIDRIAEEDEETTEIFLT